MKKTFDIINAIKVIITPWDKGFSCGILMDSKTKMTDDQYELCSTIARGMIKMATADPHTTFLAGIKGFADDDKYKKENGGVNEKANIDDTENIIDFLEYLKRKRKKELH